MAAARRTAKKTTATKAKPAPAPVEVEDEDLELTEDEVTEDNDADEADEVEDNDESGDDELEELEEDEVEETKPTTKKKAAAAPSFGIRELVALIKAETGDDTTPRAVRILIRKLARDESGRVNREIKAGNKDRYSWTGPNDAEVRAIIAAYKGGELEEEKQAKLKALKEQKAAKLAAEKAEGGASTKKATKKTAAKKPKPAPVEEVEDDEELDFDEE